MLRGTSKSIDAFLLECVDLLYSGVSDLDARRAFFRHLSNGVGSIGSGIEYSDLSGRMLAPPEDHSVYVLEPDIATTYYKYADKNPLKQTYRKTLRMGQVLFASDNIRLGSLVDTEYYQGFMRHWKLQYPARIVPQMTRDDVTICHFIKSEEDGDFTEEERLALKRIAPYMQNFFTLSAQVEALKVERQAAWATLDRLPYGVVLLDTAATPLFLNSAAQRVLDARDGLRIAGGKLATPNRTKLTAFLAAASRASSRSDGDFTTESVEIPRPSGKRPYRLTVMALRGSDLLLSNKPAVCVTIHDPEADNDENVQRVMATFGLTEAEARVAVGISLGKSLEECAAEAEQKTETARTLLKRVFSKTDTHRQNELSHKILQELLALS